MKEVFEKKTDIMKYEEKIDNSVFKERTTAKSYKGYLVGLMKKAKNDENFEILYLLNELYKKYIEYEEIKSSALVRIAKWKGKSGLHLINMPDKFVVIRFQKADQDSVPNEIRHEVMKTDVNMFIHAINSLGDIAKIKKTKEIVEKYCKLKKLINNGHLKPLFDEHGYFLWDNWFADRGLHTLGNDILGILDYYNLIHYRGGRIQVLKTVTDIQLAIKSK